MIGYFHILYAFFMMAIFILMAGWPGKLFANREAFKKAWAYWFDMLLGTIFYIIAIQPLF